MNAVRRWVHGTGCALVLGAAAAATARADTSIESQLIEAQGLTRQLRLNAAEERLRVVLQGGGSAEQDAYARLLLGIVAHERRDADAAERAYLEVIERTSSAETRAVAEANLDLLAAERASHAAYLPLRSELDRWLGIEAVIAALIAAAVLRITR